LPRDHAVDVGVRFVDRGAGVNAVAVPRICGFLISGIGKYLTPKGFDPHEYLMVV
jgi:hypothetical protein